MRTRVKQGDDYFFETPTHFDEPGFKKEAEILRKVLERSPKGLNTREMRDRMGKHFSGRYNLLDIVETLDVMEVGAQPIRYVLFKKIPVKVYAKNRWSMQVIFR
jgi:hypothetical protein